jgi:SAM-dependent methyltransferase
MSIQNRYDGFSGMVYAVEGMSKETELSWLARKAGEEGMPVCELACGAGRLAIPLAERGIEIVGMDLSATLIAHANGRLAALPAGEAERIRFVQGDLRAFDLGQRFPFVFIFFGGFEHLTEPKDQRRCLRCIGEHLEPGGLLEIEFMSPSMAPGEYFEEPRMIAEERKRIESEDVDIVERTYVRWLDTKRIHCRMEMQVRRGDGREEFHESQWTGWIFALDEIPALLAQCGFRVERLLGAHEYPLRPATPGDAAWVVDARVV